MKLTFRRSPRSSAAPSGLTEDVWADWTSLGRPTESPKAFDLDALAGLPEPVQRWLLHTIPVGAPLLTSVELHMHGQIKVGAPTRTARPHASRPATGRRR